MPKTVQTATTADAATAVGTNAATIELQTTVCERIVLQDSQLHTRATQIEKRLEMATATATVTIEDLDVVLEAATINVTTRATDCATANHLGTLVMGGETCEALYLATSGTKTPAMEERCSHLDIRRVLSTRALRSRMVHLLDGTWAGMIEELRLT